MKKVICKKTYDTETATLIKAYSFSQLGDPAGYEEDLYQTPEGLYFLHVGGGETSIYPAEDIVRMAKTKVKDWMIHTDGEPVKAGSFFLDKDDMMEADISVEG